MRVISQDGTMDVPYEMSIMWSEDNGAILLQAVGEVGEYQTFAKYSTKEKAKKAMKQLRDVYEDYLAEGTPDGNGFCFVPPKVFQFPTEEELE